MVDYEVSRVALRFVEVYRDLDFVVDFSMRFY